jgi:ankyrin repeat protein
VDPSQETTSDKTTREWNKFWVNCRVEKENAISSQSYSQPSNTHLQCLGSLEALYGAIDSGSLTTFQDCYNEVERWKFPDPLLYALSKNKIEIAEYLLTLEGYDINGCYQFNVEHSIASRKASKKFNLMDFFCTDNSRLYSSESQYYKYYNLVSPAFLAVALKDLELLKFLIDKGADCSVSVPQNEDRNNYRYIYVSPSNYFTMPTINPLMLSIANNFEEGFNLIIDTQGLSGQIDLNAINIGVTPLISAILSGRIKMAEKLIKSGVDVNIAVPDVCDGVNPLEAATRVGEPSLLEKLLERGADPKLISNKLGNNLWHLAAWRKSSSNIESICKILSSQEGLKDMINEINRPERKSPLDCAYEPGGNKFVYEVLERHGAKHRRISRDPQMANISLWERLWRRGSE